VAVAVFSFDELGYSDQRADLAMAKRVGRPTDKRFIPSLSSLGIEVQYRLANGRFWCRADIRQNANVS
jgi:hypothetical protein